MQGEYHEEQFPELNQSSYSLGFEGEVGVGGYDAPADLLSGENNHYHESIGLLTRGSIHGAMRNLPAINAFNSIDNMTMDSGYEASFWEPDWLNTPLNPAVEASTMVPDQTASLMDFNSGPQVAQSRLTASPAGIVMSKPMPTLSSSTFVPLPDAPLDTRDLTSSLSICGKSMPIWGMPRLGDRVASSAISGEGGVLGYEILTAASFLETFLALYGE
ncbi:uncharacterized protein LY89DRAFT_723871 [Mollisia scopiformis]|uniref:Uncharacterized protein n=1 Tax=Mollisia scopiformis TaxID=149040 RepID=A0A132BCB4_MOLSC|nr:uncharacterized protein LY89DRAFT_723871 [Mollisia scopiformis]KUJ10070.1 hypothetical protein LY89DRAFT_723871 [Mollisia scopiformis]